MRRHWTCQSVVGGWQTADASGALFGPVFNSCNDLWAWQKAERAREAAPDLLAALKDAVSTLEYLAPERFDNPEHEAEWQSRIAFYASLIRKAEGRVTDG